MRISTVIWVGVSLGAVSLPMACGSTFVEQTGTTTGAGGSTTTGAGGQSTSSTGSSTITATTGAGGSGGTVSAGGAGGSDVCQQACDKLKGECGVDVCAQIPDGKLPCPEYACVAQCFEATSCVEVYGCYQGGPAGDLPACLDACDTPPFKCQGPPDPGQKCRNCVMKTCAKEAIACNQDPACQPYAQCVMACAQSPDALACTNACGVDHPGANAVQGDLYQCTCSSCPACSPLDICSVASNDGGAGGSGGAGGLGGADGLGGAGGAN